LEVDDEARPSTQIYGRNRRKTPIIVKTKIGPKIPLKITKMENIAAQDRRYSIQNDSYINANQEFLRCENHPNILPLFGRLERSLTSLISSLRHEAHTTPSKINS
jgi:hypothetical protein